MQRERGGDRRSGGDDPNEGKFVLDDELPKEVQVKERKRKEEEAKTKQGKAS